MTSASLPHDLARPPLAMLLRMLDAMPFGVTLADALNPDLPLVYVNERLCAMTGYAREELLGRRGSFLQGPERDQHGVQTARQLLRTGASGAVLLSSYRKDGTHWHNKLTLSPLAGPDNRVTHWLGVHEDISEDALIMEMSAVDQLTGLPHRGALLQHLARWLSGGMPVDVLVLDVDNFANVNAAHGFALGDRVLKTLAQRLADATPQGAMLARMGGVQFVCVYSPAAGTFTTEEVGMRFLEAARSQPLLDNPRIELSLSIGTARFPEDGMDVETLVQNAKVAMHHARSSGLDYPLPWAGMLR